MRQFANKVAIITGGSSGIGKATALELAMEGAAVVIANRNSSAGEQAVEDIQAMGGKAVFVKTDVSEEIQVKNLIEKTLETFGRLDLAFNNAGIEQTPLPLTEQTEAL
jgi:NAD(P)-dependent dehydrogenase (short-subunit alcohol dehydrogenase family)